MIKKIREFFLGEQSIRQTMFKNSFWLTVGNVGSNAIKIIIVIYAARVLGAAGYGVFSYAISIAATFSILSDMGLTYLLTLKMVQGEKAQNDYFPTLIVIRLALIAMVALVTFAFGPLLAKFEEARVLIPIVAVLLAVDDLRALMGGVARAENRMDKEAFGHIFTNSLIAALSLAGLLYSPTPLMLALMYLLGSALGAVALFFTVRRSLGAMIWPFRFNPALIKNILAAAIPLGLGGAMWNLMINTDMVILGWMRSAAELGYYAAAQRPIVVLSIVSTVIVGGSFSLIARLAKEKAHDSLKRFMEKLVTFAFAAALPLGIGGAILAAPIVRFLYGTEYGGGILPFQLLLITLVMSFPSSIVTNLLLAYEQQKLYIFAMLAGALGNALLDLLLIPFFGVAGSVIATIGALGIIYGYMWQKARKLESFAVFPFLPRIGLAAVVMGAATFALHAASVNFFINILISGTVYLGALVVLKEPLLREFRELLRFE